MRVTVCSVAVGFGTCLLPQRAYETTNNYIIITIVEMQLIWRRQGVCTLDYVTGTSDFLICLIPAKCTELKEQNYILVKA